MNWNDLTFKRWKLLSDVAKLQKSSNYNELHRFDVKTIKNFELRRKTFKTTQNNESDHIIIIALIWRQNDQNYKRDQITINLHRFDVKTLKRSKMLSDVAKQQKSSNYNELHRVDVRTIKNVQLRRKTFKTTLNYKSDHIIIIASIWRQNHQNFWVRWQNYKSNQITMNCIDLMSKR